MLILRKARRTKKTPGRSASPQSLDTAGNMFLGSPLPDTQRTRRQTKTVNRDRPCLIELTAFCNKMTCYVDEEREVYAIYLALLRFLTL